MQGRVVWLKFATWILLALEFALAADIVRTAVAPTWEDITKLAVIATIRTMLNYFLAKDIAAFDHARQIAGIRRQADCGASKTGRTFLFSRPIPLDPSPVIWLSR